MIETKQANGPAQAVQDGRRGHAQDPQENNVRGTTDDEQGSDGRNGQDGQPGQEVKGPARIGAKRPIESVLDEAPRAYPSLEVRGPSPYGSNNGKDDPSLDVAGVVHAVVEGNRDRRGVDKDQKGKQEEPPPPPAVVPRKRQLGQ